jgi:hypothetical protein
MVELRTEPTMKIDRYTPEFIESFPETMGAGVLYVSLEYGTCGHLCACGCGNEVVTPLGPAQWSITYDGRSVSLWPSVGNWSLPCRSHYVVGRGGKVRWASSFTDSQIQRNRDRDRMVLAHGEDERTYERHSDRKAESAVPELMVREAGSAGVWDRLRLWWRR